MSSLRNLPAVESWPQNESIKTTAALYGLALTEGGQVFNKVGYGLEGATFRRDTR